MEYKKQYQKERRRTNIQVKIAENLRSRLNSILDGRCKAGSAIGDLGCPVDELIQRIEIMFYPRPETGEQMTWENYGLCGWHIDHIIPLSAFNLEDRGSF